MKKDRVVFDFLVILVTFLYLLWYLIKQWISGSNVEVLSILSVAAAPLALEILLALIYFLGLKTEKKYIEIKYLTHIFSKINTRCLVAISITISIILILIIISFILSFTSVLFEEEKDVYVFFLSYCFARIINLLSILPFWDTRMKSASSHDICDMRVAKVSECKWVANSLKMEVELDFSGKKGTEKKELITLDIAGFYSKFDNPQSEELLNAFKDKMVIARPKSENCEGVIMTVTNNNKLKLLCVTKGAQPGDKVG